MRKTSAAIIGCLIAPLISALIGAILTPATGGRGLLSNLGLLPIFYFFSAIVTILFGVPTFLLLRRLRLIKWWTSLAAGAVIGALTIAIVRLPGNVQFHDFLIGAPIGAASAFGFWLVWSMGQA
jgi:hypothetical protein